MSSISGKSAFTTIGAVILFLPALMLFSPQSLRAQGGQGPPPNPNPPQPYLNIPPEMAHRQRKALRKLNFEKTKRDADQLVTLAEALKADLKKSNSDELPVDVVKKARKIQKLAKKIQNEIVQN